MASSAQAQSIEGSSTGWAARPHDRIVRAARSVFFKQGFKQVTTDVLAREAGVSKATLYKYFPSMEAVLQAVIQAEVATFSQSLPLEATTPEQFRETLVRFGEHLLRFLNKPETIQFAQLMFEEARLRPDIARTYYETAYVGTLDDLSHILRFGAEHGFIPASLEPRELAEQLLGMWEGFHVVRAQLGLTKRPFKQPLVWAQRCVDALLGSP